MGERERSGAISLVRRRLKGEQRLIESGRLPDRALSPVPRVAVECIGVPVAAPILSGLVGVATGRPGRAHQGQPQGTPLRTIPAVLGVAEDGDAGAAVRYIGPLLGRNLVELGTVDASTDDPESGIVGRLLGAESQRQPGLENSAPGAPLEAVLDLYSLAARGEADSLREARSAERTLDLQGDSSRTRLEHPATDQPPYPLRRRAHVVVRHLPSGELRRAIG